MARPREYRRFSINPVEMVIFAVIAVVFGNSIHRLMSDTTHTIQTATGEKSETLPELKSAQNFVEVAIDCNSPSEPPATTSTTKPKLRVSGPICYSDSGVNRRPAAYSLREYLVKTNVVNNSNGVHATVFTFSNPDKFSTDFIQLIEGNNEIDVSFILKGGKVQQRKLSVVRKSDRSSH